MLVGDDPASEIYVGSKAKATKRPACARSTIACRTASAEAELLALVRQLNADPAVHGILVQLPLPKQIDAAARARRRSIRPRTSTASTRSTPGGSRPACRRWRHARRSAASCWRRRCMPSLAGLEAVVIGRSNIVGKPVAQLAAGRERNGHHRPFADARPAGGLPPRRPPGRPRSAGRRWCAAAGSSPARP